jgi:hypothetical protein
LKSVGHCRPGILGNFACLGEPWVT